jgi:hypothetical protein
LLELEDEFLLESELELWLSFLFLATGLGLALVVFGSALLELGSSSLDSFKLRLPLIAAS